MGQAKAYASITDMVNAFAAENVMLPRTEESVRQTLDDWLVAERTRLRGAWRRATRAQADLLETAGDPVAAWTLLRRLLDDDLLPKVTADQADSIIAKGTAK